MVLVRLLFKWLVQRSNFVFLRKKGIDNFTPFKVIEATLSNDKKIVFSIMKDRRQKSRYRIFTTYLVEVDVHKDLPSSLQEMDTIQLLTINVFGAFLFSDRLIADVLLQHYLEGVEEIIKYEKL